MQEWCKALAGSREDAPFMGSTTSTGFLARHSLHQPSSEMGRAKVFSWHRPKTKLRMAGYFLFELQLLLSSLLFWSGPEDFGCISHLAATVGAAQDLRAAASGRSRQGCSGHAGDLVSVSFDFIFLPRAQALEPKEETSVRVRT